MPRLFSEFPRFMRNLRNRIFDNAGEAARKSAVAAGVTLTLQTPVDTGRAVSNWQAGIDFVPDDPREPFVPGSGGSTASANILAAQSEIRAVATSFNSRRNISINIANPTPYILDIRSAQGAALRSTVLSLATQSAQNAASQVRILGRTARGL